MPRRPGEKFTARRHKEREKRYNETRPKRHDIYKTARWRRLSRDYRSEHPLCEECLRNGITTTAQLVDHIVEISDGGDMWDRNNLQSLCQACHNRKTLAERAKRVY